jgi:hypothetical protein
MTTVQCIPTIFAYRKVPYDTVYKISNTSGSVLHGRIRTYGTYGHEERIFVTVPHLFLQPIYAYSRYWMFLKITIQILGLD